MLFQITEFKQADLKDCLIATEHKSFLFDEFDYLFTGLNQHGHRIVGNLMCEHDGEGENWDVRYLHMIVSEEQYMSFLNKQIDYLSLIKQHETFFLIDRDVNDKVIQSVSVKLSSIPNQYLPLKGIMCPQR